MPNLIHPTRKLSDCKKPNGDDFPGHHSSWKAYRKPHSTGVPALFLLNMRVDLHMRETALQNLNRSHRTSPAEMRCGSFKA